MSDSDPVLENSDLLTITARIVIAHLGHNAVPPEALPILISSVHQALAGLDAPPVADVQPGPAAPARRSIFPDYLICLEDGAKVKMLKPYIQRRFGLTPAAYRAKWGLSSNYPMVAPSYAARRSALARQFGLGRSAQNAVAPAAEVQAAPENEPEVEHTAESVFANFGAPSTESASGPSLGRQKRKRFSDQLARQMPARRRSAPP